MQIGSVVWEEFCTHTYIHTHGICS